MRARRSGAKAAWAVLCSPFGRLEYTQENVQTAGAAFADLIGRVKGSCSKRLREKGILGFAWHNGYGAFSVSESNVEAVTAYISAQAEHHRKFSYQEELRELLKRHRVAFDERYLWE